MVRGCRGRQRLKPRFWCALWRRDFKSCPSPFFSESLSFAGSRSRALFQQSANNAHPFRIERLSTDWLASAAVPVGGVFLIAFLAMEVGVNP